MNISEFCINRPVFTFLLMAALMVGGFAGYKSLPVSALPNVDFPTISVAANLPGAAPETMASAVAMPLERQFSTISGVTQMTSTSTLGNTSITLQFDLDRNIDGAALDVQTGISAALATLPKEMTTPPSFKKVNPAAAPVLFVALSSDTLPMTQVNEFADTIVAQRLSTIAGVAQVNIYGQRKYAVRVKVDPSKLAAQNLTIVDVGNAVNAAASNAPVGLISGEKQLYNLYVGNQPANAADFQDIIVTWKNDAPIRLKDIADVSDNVENDRSFAAINGKPAVVLAISRQPDANTIDVVQKVRNLLPEFQREMPPGMQLTPLFDRSIGVRDAVHDVQITLMVTICLVILVIFLFIRNVRATIIPSVAVPLSIIATYGAMALCGFSIDNVSLLALTLCVGFVVDDAIVMLENIMRHIEGGMSPLEAAKLGSKEIGFTIISITFSLVAVFIPILFMGGMVGRVLNEFAVTISVAILISGLISLTLTPMLCSRVLRHHGHETRPWAIKCEDTFEWMLRHYDSSLKWCLRHRRIMLGITFATLLCSILAFIYVPKGFFPEEDTGFISGSTEASQDISYAAMVEKQSRVAAIVQADPAVETVFYSIGTAAGGSLNAGRIFVSLHPKSKRDSIDNVVARLKNKIAGVQGINVFFQPVQNIQIGARPSKSLYQYTLTGDHLDELYAWAGKLENAMAGTHGFMDVTTDLQIKSLKAVITPDSDKASSLGINNAAIRAGLFGAYGDQQIGYLYTSSNYYQIILGVLDSVKQLPDDIGRLYLRGNGSNLVPLSAISNITRTNGPLSINHQGQQASVTISFNLSPGESLGTAVDKIGAIQKQMHMPATILGSFAGNAQVFQAAEQGQGMLIGITILVIYIILGMLYESFIHPITILSGLPSAGIGAVLSLLLVGMDLSVIAVVGVILLIGIVKKNAIMMVDFAITEREQGKSPEDSIYQACLLRFRPITMTSLSAIFGTLPIAFAFGAGAELRQPLGVAVVGGLLISQVLTLYITPVIYLYLEEWRVRRSVRAATVNERAVVV